MAPGLPVLVSVAGLSCAPGLRLAVPLACWPGRVLRLRLAVPSLPLVLVLGAWCLVLAMAGLCLVPGLRPSMKPADLQAKMLQRYDALREISRHRCRRFRCRFFEMS